MAGFNFGGFNSGKKKKHKTNYDRPEVPEKKDAYEASISQQAGDYDEIMDRFRKIADEPPGSERNALIAQYKNAITNSNVTLPASLEKLANSPDLKYARGPELTAAFGEMADLARTGGYSEADKANLRARGVSPIRAVYANAQNNIRRQRAIQGGYSPNYNASSVKMAREMSDQIGQRVTDVEAGIAEQVARGRLSAAPQYAQLAQGETRDINDISARNESNRFRTNAFNSGIDQQNVDNRFRADSFNNQNRGNALSGLERLYGNEQNKRMSAAQGMTNLYGTTPALVNTYGNQAAEQYRLRPQPRRYRRGGVSIPGGY